MGIIGTIKQVLAGKIIVNLIRGQNHTRTGNNVAPYGYDAAPLPGMKAVAVDVNGNECGAVIGVIDKDRKAKPGETRLYSNHGCEVYLNAEGQVCMKSNVAVIIDAPEVHLGGSDESLVTYSVLEEKLKELKQTFMTHKHTAIGLGSATSMIIDPLASDFLDISKAKTKKVKTNG